MNSPKSRGTVFLILALGMNVILGMSGCGGNQNEAEFLNSAPPGTPSPYPDETVAQRKARTKAEPKSATKKGQPADAKTAG